MTVEDKIKTLEDALISKVLDTNQVIGAIQTGLVPFDKAQIAYAKHFEDRLKAIDVSKIYTGSEI